MVLPGSGAGESSDGLEGVVRAGRELDLDAVTDHDRPAPRAAVRRSGAGAAQGVRGAAGHAHRRLWAAPGILGA